MVYILSSGEIVPDNDPRALAAQGRQSSAAPSSNQHGRRQGGLGTLGGDSNQNPSGSSGSARAGGGQSQHGANNHAAVPAWLAPGTTLGDVNTRLVGQVPPQVTAVAPPVVLLGVLLAYALAGPQAAVILALVYFFSSQQQQQ
eukprot:m.1139222 g.1139222  ORF g.1139222 m.1139222 type:complete len:143 (+) comp24441_c0_seq78:243-671(+)